MPPAEFEPTVPASERLQTHALDRAATGIGLTDFSFPYLPIMTLLFRSLSFLQYVYCVQMLCLSGWTKRQRISPVPCLRL